jgi:hypothetical protein
LVIVTGTSGHDTRIGTAADDTVSGAGGNDLLFGLKGRDYLYGGLGNDSAYGGDERDWLYGGNGRDSLFGDALGDRLEGGNGNDVLSGGTGMDTAWGGAGADQLWGGDQADTLRGGNGNDLLGGGTGNDSLDGGNGTDTARYAGPRSGYEVLGNADGTVTVTDLDTTNGDMGTDRLRGIEGLNFADGAAPLARGETFATTEDAGRALPELVITAADLLANDFGDGLAILAASDIDTSSTRGHLEIETDGDGRVVALSYAPTGIGYVLDGDTRLPSAREGDLVSPDSLFDGDLDFQKLGTGDSDSDSFTYTATAADGSRTTATVRIDVSGINDAPLVYDLFTSGPINSDIPLQLRAADIDSPGVYFRRVNSTTNGALIDFVPVEATITEHGYQFEEYLLYRPRRFYVGVDEFTYEAVDGAPDFATSDIGLGVVVVKEVVVGEEIGFF